MLSGWASPSRRHWIEEVIVGQTVVSVFFLPNQKRDVNSMLQVRMSFKHKSSITCKSKLPKKSREKKKIVSNELLVGLPPQPRLGGRATAKTFILRGRKMCLPTQENGRQNPISGGTCTFLSAAKPRPKNGTRCCCCYSWGNFLILEAIDL